MFENRVLRQSKYEEDGTYCLTKSFTVCAAHKIEYFSGNEIKKDEKLGHVADVRER